LSRPGRAGTGWALRAASALVAAAVGALPVHAAARTAGCFSLVADPGGPGLIDLTAGRGAGPFTLRAGSRREGPPDRPSLPPAGLAAAAVLRLDQDAGDASRGRKRPWLAGIEVFGANMGLWVYSRYVAKEDWAYISWESVKDNFRNGFEYDNDGFFTNFFMHPYNGSFYYNAARSLNMNFLESSLYTLGGSLMWEMFLENQYPSTNDLITTVAGGVYVGEVFHRMSSLILDDEATGAERTWREILAFLINPMRGLNRFLLGGGDLASEPNGRPRPSMEGHVALTSVYVVDPAESSATGAGTALEIDFLYGERFKTGGSGRTPFDLILFNTSLRMTGRLAHLAVDSHALIAGWERHNGRGRGHLYGLFQHFDYLDNELINIGGTSLAGGAVSFYPLGATGRLELRTSAQLGISLITATDNIYYPEAVSEYHYGMGPMAKFEGRLAHKRWGWLSLRFNHFRNYAIQGNNSADRPSHDFLSVLKAQYGVAIRKGIGFRVEYVSYFRRNDFEGYDRVNTSLSHLGLSLILGFS